jgi:hypothetical protein
MVNGISGDANLARYAVAKTLFIDVPIVNSAAWHRF